MLLGLDAKDWDVATDAPPDRVPRTVSSRPRRSERLSASFWSAAAAASSRWLLFVPTAPTKTAAGPAAFASPPPRKMPAGGISRSTAFFFDPIENRVIDFVGGRDDLNARRIRAIGSPAERFGEDHLRPCCRAVRFATRLGFDIEPATAAAIRSHAPRIKGISPERIAEELRLMLTPPTRDVAWMLLWNLNLASEIFRFLPATPKTLDQTRSIFLKLEKGRPIPLGLSLAAACLCTRAQAESLTDLLPLLTKSEISRSVRAMRQSLRISNDESDDMSQTLSNLEPILQPTPPTLAQKKRFLAHPEVGPVAPTHGINRRGRATSESDRQLTGRFAQLKSSRRCPGPTAGRRRTDRSRIFAWSRVSANSRRSVRRSARGTYYNKRRRNETCKKTLIEVITNSRPPVHPTPTPPRS